LNDSQSARRYARAIIETATQSLAVRDELTAIADALKANPALLDALSNPGVPPAKKKAIAAEVFQGLSAPLPKLFEMLIDSAKIALLPEIASRYRNEWNSRNNVHAAKVVTALAIDDAGKEQIKKAIERAVSGTVEMETRVDSSLVGGLKVEVDGHMFDGTVKARLKALRQQLL
jgi:F-type H+-transporting ATPase subunit delta